jgi:hypothetical protein
MLTVSRLYGLACLRPIGSVTHFSLGLVSTSEVPRVGTSVLPRIPGNFLERALSRSRGIARRSRVRYSQMSLISIDGFLLRYLLR